MQEPGVGSAAAGTAVAAAVIVVVGAQAQSGDVLAAWSSAGVAVVLGSVQLLFVRQQSRRNDVVLLKDLRAAWSELRRSWRISAAAALGVDDFYAPHLEDDDRRNLAAMRDSTRMFMQSIPRFDDADVEIDAAWSEWRSSVKWLEDHRRAVTSFLGQLAEMVLSGKISVNLAYSLVGPEIVPLSKPLRMVIGLTEPEDVESRFSWSQGTVGRDRGSQSRILAMTDLFWAEAVRRGDLSPHRVIEVAEYKVSEGTGERCRRRLRRIVRMTGGGRFRSIVMARGLIVAEKPNSLDMYRRLDNSLHPPTDWPFDSSADTGWFKRTRD